ncbi:hypothetical protein GV819_25575 [Pseudomonas sp. Fl5BN2]|uniref:hypothetical protein n=1 Tax=Pseudomonas sp. Fl5BN2 TaxID=2697652 RepID=UPI001377F60F|nr:hypothetical protein [Pseudomonas sp. Fl5BN2]NBF05670.1 hypothetical protein [Pseudomonas sp. Fl5BN2]
MSVRMRHPKIIALASGLICAVFLSGQTFAQECQINLSESNMDFGRVTQRSSSDPLDMGNLHALGNRFISLHTSCPGASKLMLLLRGDALGEQFRFAKQGRVSVSLSNAVLDGRNVELAQTKSVGAALGPHGSSIEAVPGDRVIPISGGLPAEGSVLSLQVEIRPVVPVAELLPPHLATTRT